MSDIEIPRPLSAKFKEDFAYPTVKDRMPVILTKAIDTMHRMKQDVLLQHGEQGTEELKEIIGRMSKLRNQLQTDKEFVVISDDLSDGETWNSYLAEMREKLNGQVTWFNTPWLYSECYFYRRIWECVQLSSYLKKLDPFGIQKQNALQTSLASALLLAADVEAINLAPGDKLQHNFLQMMQISLWGNKCDLSISAGAENTQTADPVDQLASLSHRILQDQSISVWNHLQQCLARKTCVVLHIVLDNAGFELFADLCFVDFLLSMKLVHKVYFHAKTMPWFVSDVTPNDWSSTMDTLQSSNDPRLAKCASKWQNWILDSTWVFCTHDFWCTPFDFANMQKISPDLYKTLSQADLIIFKGDLNYRKLVGDFKWDYTTPFKAAMRGFLPAPLCTLRTLKCDLVVGLDPGQGENQQATNSNWMITGDNAVIQFCS